MEICSLTDIGLDFLRAANNYIENKIPFSIYLYGKEKRAIIISYEDMIYIINENDENRNMINYNTYNMNTKDFIMKGFKDIEKNYEMFENFLYQENKNALAYKNRCRNLKNEFNKLKNYLK